MSSFAFLKASWGLELDGEALKKVEYGAESLSKRDVEQYLKDTDIRKFGVVSGLPKEVTRLDIVPEGKYFVQLVKVADVTQPTRFQEDFEGGKWRLLSLELHDGEQKMKCLEYQKQNIQSLGVHLAPGTKMLLWSTPQSPLQVQNGHLMLTGDTIEVLGGEVEKLMETWKASKEVEANRLLWRTEGIKKNDKLDPAPPWVDFNPSKARGHGHNKADLDAERESWGKASTFTNTTAGLGSSNRPKDDDGQPRFDKSVWAGEEAAPQFANIGSNTFAQAPGKGGKKGDKGKGGGKSDGGGGGKRGRRGHDDDGGEEKRAPVAAPSLAAFIKPTKKGESAEDKLAALATDTKPSSSDPQWGGQEEWGSGWDAGWSASGQGWSSSGYGGGGGGGHRGGGGGGKGSRQGGGGKGSRKGGGGGGGGWHSGGW